MRNFEPNEKQIDMELTNKEKQILKSEIEDLIEFGGKSYYMTKQDTVIRVSDHLPNFSNFECYNEGCEKIVLICTDVEDHEIDSFVEEHEDDYEEIVCISIDNEYVTAENFDTIPDFKFL